LNLKVGDKLSLRYGLDSVSMRVAGEVPGAAAQAIGVMDIGSAQWAFNRLGVVSRLDLRLEDWQSTQGLSDALKAQSEPLQLVATQDRDRRMSLLSRAYRVNLTVLAMVALLTGGFLVSTAVHLSIVRQRSELALLGVLGASESWLRRFVWAQGGLIGAVGGVLGVGMGVLLATALFVWQSSALNFSLLPQQLLWALVFAFTGAAMLGALGLIAGLWADKFDQMAVFQNFVIMPMTFLSGVFYSIHSLPPFWQTISHLNPFFYMIDGFRYGFFGVSDISPWISLAMVAAAWLAVSATALHLLKIGYKIRH
jgi:ABC-type lipoprotein release transport system permease subunit